MNSLDWCWCMTYCEQRRLPPAQEWAWNQAKEALAKHKATHPTDSGQAGAGGEE